MTDVFIDKDLVKARFSKNLATYHSKAAIQKSIAYNLWKILSNYKDTDFYNIFEIGVGTGYLTSCLLEKEDTKLYIGNDIVEQSEIYFENAFRNSGKDIDREFLVGDGEGLVKSFNRYHFFDLVSSSSVFQWFSDLENVFSSLKNLIKPSGLLAFTTFGPDNFKEINKLLSIGLSYKSLSDLRQMVENSGFQVLTIAKEVETLYFSTPLQVLKHIKETGVSGVGDFRWNRVLLSQFIDRYNRYFSSAEGVSLTYEPIYIVARNSNSQ